MQPSLGQLTGEVDRRLASELDDDARSSLLIDHRGGCLVVEGFEVQTVAAVEVG